MGRPERIVRIMSHLIEAGQLTTSRARQVAGEGVGKRMILDDLRFIADGWPRCRRVEEGADSRWVVDAPGTADMRQLLDQLAVDIGREHVRFLDDTRLSHPKRTQARRAAWRAEGLDRKLYFQHEPARAYDAHTEELSDVLDALFEELQLTVQYRGGDGIEQRLERQTVLSLVVYRRAVYTLLWDTSRDSNTPLRIAVDRIIDTTVHDEPAVRPTGWHPKIYYRDAFGVILDRPPERVVLRFTARVAAYVRARVWHPSEEKVALPDGGVELRMRVTGRELVRWALEWGPQVEVVAPAWLREAVVAELRGALGRYGGLLADEPQKNVDEA
jgi:predicted DNA-binding transcriptional regulator YafY